MVSYSSSACIARSGSVVREAIILLDGTWQMMQESVLVKVTKSSDVLEVSVQEFLQVKSGAEISLSQKFHRTFQNSGIHLTCVILSNWFHLEPKVPKYT